MNPPAKEKEEEEEVDFDQQPCSDLSNYENPYKKKFRPLYKEQSTDNLYMKANYNTTFIGMESTDVAAACQVLNYSRILQFS